MVRPAAGRGEAKRAAGAGGVEQDVVEPVAVDVVADHRRRAGVVAVAAGEGGEGEVGG